MKTFLEFLEEGEKKRYKKEYEKVAKEVKPQVKSKQPIIHYGGDDLKPGSPELQARLDFMEKQRIKGLKAMKKRFQQSQDT